jgi:multiple RNA-binding domain-containing protein 1
LEPTEARAAFKQLAYSRYKSSLLYLEKAPLGIFAHGYHESKQAASMQAQSTQRQVDVEALLESNPTVENQYDHDIGTSTLFIKNLNFDTTEATLRDVFTPVGQLRKVTIRKKKNPKRPDQLLSMGFGFIEFAGEDTANRALKSLQGFVVDGHALQLKISSQSNMDEISGSSTKSKANIGTKLIVRNIPFEATRKDIMELFR